MYTNENRYQVANTPGHNANDVTLYEACKALVRAHREGALLDGSHVRRNGRAVAFWSEWHSSIRPMFGAYAVEYIDIKENLGALR